VSYSLIQRMMLAGLHISIFSCVWPRPTMTFV